MIQHLIDFFNHPFFICVGGLTTLIAVIGLCYTIILVVRGLVPVWYRLGRGLADRRIAVFADDEFDNLKGVLVDSGIFSPENIHRIDRNSLKKAESATVLLVHWSPFRDNIDEILRSKKDTDALVIYAPRQEGFLDDASTTKINQHRNTIVVNFRGRLLNDIFTSMITTSYKK